MDKPPGASDACRECRFLPVAGSRLSGGRQRCRRGRGLRAAFPQQVASAISEHLLRRSHGRGVGGRPRGHLLRKAGQGPAPPPGHTQSLLGGRPRHGGFHFCNVALPWEPGRDVPCRHGRCKPGSCLASVDRGAGASRLTESSRPGHAWPPGGVGGDWPPGPGCT